VERDGLLLMVDDDRFPLKEGRSAGERSIRFRTLGCYPLTGAVESEAKTLPEVIQEMLLTTTSERQGRASTRMAAMRRWRRRSRRGISDVPTPAPTGGQAQRPG
jgi:sulfate adenylyltransferase subunit 2